MIIIQSFWPNQPHSKTGKTHSQMFQKVEYGLPAKI